MGCMPQARGQGPQGNWSAKRDRSSGAEDYCGAKGDAILLAESSLHRHRLECAAVLARQQADQPVDAVVAHLLGENTAVGGGQADSSDPDIEDLPRPVGLLEVVFDRDRIRL